MNKNKTVLDNFIAYCRANPELRFWQALANWSKAHCIYKVNEYGIQEDTFYFEGKDR